MNTARYIVIACIAALVAADAGAEKTVLDNRSFWRWHFTWKTVQVRRASGELEFVKVARRGRGRTRLTKVARAVRSALPPAGWTAVDFDDGAWARARGPMYTRGTREIALICARGKFIVAEPSKAAGLRLALTYRGGAVVYLNGREIARGALAAGKIDLETPGEDYPTEAYVTPEGRQLRWIGFGDPEKHRDRFALRDRKLEVALPPSGLRKGVNVLAVELHRAPVAEVFYTAKYKGDARYAIWDMIGLERIALTAPGAAAVPPNVARPAGLQVWNCPPYVSVHNVDHGDPHEPLRPVEIAAAANGAFSGKVVVSSDKAIKGLKAAVTDLTGPRGSIPASAARVRFGQYGLLAEDPGEDHRLRAPIPHRRERRRFVGLLHDPPAEVAVDAKAGGAVVPVWVTVRVPAGAKPGKYAGTLTVGVAGRKEVETPVVLRVARWALPDPRRFLSFVGLVQSPETLSIQYQAGMWSERHWKLIDRSFEWMGRLGAKTIYIPAIAETYFGNPHSMVRWVKQDDGSYTRDFSIVEKYLDTAVKHLGEVPVVCIYVWDQHTGAMYMGGSKYHDRPDRGLPFTVVDPKTGQLTNVVGPTWGTPAARPFLKALLDGLREVLAKRGLEKSMMVGITGDRRPHKSAVEDLKAVAPHLPWVSSSHNAPPSLYGQPIAYATQVWGVGSAPDPAEKRYRGWQVKRILAVFPRYGSGAMGLGMRPLFAAGCYRLALEGCLTARGGGQGTRGVGRCGADFWPVLPGARGRKGMVLSRYPETSNWHGGWLHFSTPAMLAPGPDGAVGTIRFEALRESIQEAEARIFIEKALTDPAARARLGQPLARRCQELLDERIRVNRRAIAGGGRYLTWHWYAASGIGQRVVGLYDAAAEVRAALRTK